MRKRTAIASTLVYDPSILLMDEPFSALDVQTRNLMENDLLGLWEESGHQTVFFVTHDLEEAIGLSDRIIVLTASPGRILGDYRVDLPRPRNLLEVKLDEGFIDLYLEHLGRPRGRGHEGEPHCFEGGARRSRRDGRFLVTHRAFSPRCHIS